MTLPTPPEILAVKREQVRVMRALSETTNEQCSCGGSGPRDPRACPACLFYHRVLDLLVIEGEW